MKKTDRSPPIDGSLRKRAEERVNESVPVANTSISAVDEQKLLHELQVHQIELELQNDELLLAHAEAKAALEQYQELYDYAPVGYFSLDHDGSIRKANLTGAVMLKIERSHLIDRRLQLFLTSDTRGVFTDFLERVFQTTTRQKCEVALHLEGGQPVFIRIDAEAPEGGRLCFAAVTDITERSQLSQKLQNAHDKLEETVHERTRDLTSVNTELRLAMNYNRRLIEASLDPFVTISPDGKITDVNYATEKVTGYSREELIGTDFSDYFTDPEKARTAYQRAFCDGAVRDYPLHTVHRDGHETSVLYNAAVLLDENGACKGVFAAARDITELKALEAQLFLTQKMEAIGQLAGGIAHDFNNALTVIIGFSNLMEMQMDTADPQRENISHILSAASKATELTRSLLAFSRKQIMNKHTVDLNLIIENVEKFLHRIIGEDIALKIIIYKDLLAVNADSGQIEQVLLNLAVNARDAMPHGGMLTIETGYALMDAAFNNVHGFGEAGEYALVTITDSGTGIDDVTRKRLFEPFFTTKEMGKGTGLGLSIVYGIVKQHNGFIDVDSEPGVGTTFSIYLPLTKTEIRVETGHIDERPKKGTETLLVADDDALILELTVKILEQFGYTVITAIDGLDVVNKFSENREKIALLILDIMMPKMNGKEAYDEIRKIRPDMRAIFVSGYTADIIHSRGTLDESLEYISKPLKFMKLLQKVREVLDGK
ncbi:MAG: PAS domain S-box protein [Desulfuromonadaceae bacterium]|nr:PAS domain S-box protein [Desulfuromonadaceae bacterium]